MNPWRAIAWLGQTISTVSLVILPIWWPEGLAQAKSYPFLWYSTDTGRQINGVAVWFLLATLVLVISQIADKKLMAIEVSGEMKSLVSDREFMEAYTESIESAILLVRASDGMSPEELVRARRQILYLIRLVVHYYFDKSDLLEINACYMLAYPAERAPDGIAERVRFKEDDRLLKSYAYVLDLVLWAEDKDDLPKQLAIPVEDATVPQKKLKLLPGAPAAYALDKVFEIDDTKKLKHYFETDGQNVDREIAKQQMEFFEQQGYRSFASYPLKHDGQRKGVLNVQSAKPFTFGKKDNEAHMVTELLLPLRTSLSMLI